jgi:TrmH family RNA methyltransferase
VARRRDGEAVVLDGEHLLAEALAAGVVIDAVLATADVPSDLLSRAREAGAQVHEVTADVVDAASPVRHPSGVVAIGRWAPAPLAAALGGSESGGPCLGLVSVQDPGNLGSAIRAAHALGARGVLALDDSADPAGWRALRGAMGSTFHLPVARGRTGDAMTHARRIGLPVAAAAPAHRAEGARDPSELPHACLVLLGNEGAGLPDDLVAQADVRVAVPMRPGVDSLNVAVTAALILDAVRRAGLARTRGPS